ARHASVCRDNTSPTAITSRERGVLHRSHRQSDSRGRLMPRALWRGAISSVLIYVPVEVHAASKENTLPLHMLDSRDCAPIGYHRINKRTGKEVDWEHIVKGYEYKKGD